MLWCIAFDVRKYMFVISFPLCIELKAFGYPYIRDACLRYLDLWKGKHETGQWLETKTTEVHKSELTANASETILSNEKAGVDESTGLCLAHLLIILFLLIH